MNLNKIDYRAVRKSMGMTQEEVAEASGVSTATVSRLENRSANVTYDTAGNVVSGLRALSSQCPLLPNGRPTVPTKRVVSRINRALDRMGMPQAVAADLVGVSPKTVNNYVTGRRKAPITFIMAFYNVFGYDLTGM